MEENKAYDFRSLALVATGGILLWAGLAWLVQLSRPLEQPSSPPGFGWSWDFDYESAMQNPGPTPNAALYQPASPPTDQLTLPLNETVAVAGLKIIYRGSSGSGKFRLDVIIPMLDPGFAYSHELSANEARKGFRLVDERFAATAIGPHALRLRHLTP